MDSRRDNLIDGVENSSYYLHDIILCFKPLPGSVAKVKIVFNNGKCS